MISFYQEFIRYKTQNQEYLCVNVWSVYLLAKTLRHNLFMFNVWFVVFIFNKKLTHNPELSRIAQEYANYLAKIKKLKHSSNRYNNEPMGENLAFAFDSRLDFYSGDLESFILV